MTKPKTKRGRFIVIEGLDGAGTTTQAKRLVSALDMRKKLAIYTFEPSEGPIGSLIRLALHKRIVAPDADGGVKPLDKDTLSLLFSADRLDHLTSTISPALARGVWAICDRYDYSTRAYQAATGRADDDAWIKTLNSRAARPDLTFFLRVRPKVALARLGTRESLSIFEKEAFLTKVAARYEAIFANEPEVVTINGELDVEAITEAMLAELTRRHWL